MAPDCEIFVPNNSSIIDAVKDAAELFDISPVRKQLNPLWKATDELYRSGYEDGAGYVHSEQLQENYDIEFPFLFLKVGKRSVQ